MQDLIREGNLTGDFSKIAQEMVELYIQKTGDIEIKKYLALPYAFQTFAKSVFTPNLTDNQRRFLFNTGCGALISAQNKQPFNVKMLNKYAISGRLNS